MEEWFKNTKKKRKPPKKLARIFFFFNLLCIYSTVYDIKAWTDNRLYLGSVRMSQDCSSSRSICIWSNKVCKAEGKSLGISFPASGRCWSIFPLSARECPGSSECSAPSGSGRVAGWAGRAGPALLSLGKLQARVEAAGERTVLARPLQQASTAPLWRCPWPGSQFWFKGSWLRANLGENPQWCSSWKQTQTARPCDCSGKVLLWRKVENLFV